MLNPPTKVIAVLLAALLLLSSCGDGAAPTPEPTPYNAEEAPFVAANPYVAIGEEWIYFSDTETGLGYHHQWFRAGRDGSPPEEISIRELSGGRVNSYANSYLVSLHYHKGYFITGIGTWLRESDGETGRFESAVFDKDIAHWNGGFALWGGFVYVVEQVQNPDSGEREAWLRKIHFANIENNIPEFIRNEKGEERENPDYIPDAFKIKLARGADPDALFEIIYVDRDWIYYTVLSEGADGPAKKLYRISQTGEGGENLITQGSGFVFEGGYIYYIEEYVKESHIASLIERYPLFRVKTDGTEHVRVADAAGFTKRNEILNIAISDSYVYYITGDDSGGFLTRSRKDGSGRPETVVPAHGHIAFYGGALYFYHLTEEPGGSRPAPRKVANMYKLDEAAIAAGKTEQNLQRGTLLNKFLYGGYDTYAFDYFRIFGDWMVFADNGDIYRMRTDGTEKERMSSVRPVA